MYGAGSCTFPAQILNQDSERFIKTRNEGSQNLCKLVSLQFIIASSKFGKQLFLKIGYTLDSRRKSISRQSFEAQLYLKIAFKY